MQPADPLAVAAWRLAVGDLRSEDLPDLATAALVRGLDSPSLRVLAGQSRDDVRDSADLFRATLDELEIQLPGVETAQWNLIRETAREIASGEVSPASGAAVYWNAYTMVRHSGDLRIFVGLLSMLDDHPDDIVSLEAQIATEAKALLDRGELRVWVRLCAAIGSSPLTETYGYDAIALDVAGLGLAPRLAERITAWDRRFQSVFASWPKAGGFASIKEAEAFADEGQTLTTDLQDQMGDRYVVEYMPEPIRPPDVRLRRRALRWWLR